MKLDSIDIDTTLSEVEALLKNDKHVSPALKSFIMVLVMVVKLLTNRLGLNSRNSSKPPSTDNKNNNKNNAPPTNDNKLPKKKKWWPKGLHWHDAKVNRRA